MHAVVVIPARTGSRRLPNKNFRLLRMGTKVTTLVSNAIEIATKATFPRTVVLTSDANLSGFAGKVNGCEVRTHVRPRELATDEATSFDVVFDALHSPVLTSIPYEVVFLLQPTSPFVRPQTLDEAYRWLKADPGLNAVVGYNQYTLKENGAVYAVRRAALWDERSFYPPGTGAILMSRFESLDVDELADLRLVEAVAAKKVRKWIEVK